MYRQITPDQIEAGRQELKAAFSRVAEEAGFRVKGNHALRRKDGAQQSMNFARSRFAPAWSIDLMVRIDRPHDQGEEVKSRWDIGTSVEEVAADTPEDRDLFRSATDLTNIVPPEGRGAVLERFTREALPWFDEISNREAIERTTYDNDYRIQTCGIVMRGFYDDFGLPFPPTYS